MKFSGHGHFNIELQGDLLMVTVHDTFNYEGALAYSEALTAQVRELGTTPFSLVIDLTQFSGCTPEGWREVYKLNDYLLSTPMLRKALVVTKALDVAFAEKSNQQGLKSNTRIFDTMSSAIDWLSQTS